MRKEMFRFIGIILGCTLFLFTVVDVAYPWGSAGHRLINLKAVMHLPASMDAVKKDSAFYQSYASAPDYRKNSADTSFFAETYRHYIDIDIYPNYHTLPHTLDSMVMIYGRSYVRQNGTLPWAILLTFDSLTSQLARGSILRAESTMSDLGHYVGDAHQPLHCTNNYDGAYTGNSGIHSRYETSMINTYQSLIAVQKDSIEYIALPLDFAFEFINQSNALVDSVLTADTYAKSVSGWTGTGSAPPAYYEALWMRTQNFTRQRIQNATQALASLWYTAWVNAYPATSVKYDENRMVKQFVLEQNYPNPFNPTTKIRFTITGSRFTTLIVYDALGQVVATLINEVKQPGEYQAQWDASGGLPSGVYFYKLQVYEPADGSMNHRFAEKTRIAGTFAEVKKMVLLK